MTSQGKTVKGPSLPSIAVDEMRTRWSKDFVPSLNIGPHQETKKWYPGTDTAIQRGQRFSIGCYRLPSVPVSTQFGRRGTIPYSADFPLS